MDLSPGIQVGAYVVIAPLGAGGMGEVYKARDSKLGREVALKVLPVALAVDAQYMSRFQHEAQILASLNHPNIAQIYGLEGNAIVMELIDGPTLADRIAAGVVPIKEALPIAKQIAEALEAAHQKGIIHRDLKPANIKITRQGVVKVLDFGLAKIGGLNSAANPGNSPTLTLRTQAGVILGTAAYMSPEQAEGKVVDARSDIFSFGAVLYEMVTGTRPFRGESLVSILAAVLGEEPKSVRALNPSVPAGLQLVIQRCLAKHLENRWQNIVDVRLLLDDLQHEEVRLHDEPIPTRTKRALAVRLAIPLCLVAVLAGALLWWTSIARSSSVARVAPPVYTMLTSDSGLSFEPAISPDGKLLAYASDRAGEGSLDIWVRQLPNGHPVRITSSKADEREPDFSPDGSKIVFRSEDAPAGISIISPFGGEARKIAARGRHPRFSPDGKWIAYWIGERHQRVFGTVWIVPSAGGEPKEITPPQGGGEDPIWAPDSRGVIMLSRVALERPVRSNVDEHWIGWVYQPIDGSRAEKLVSDTELRNLGFSEPPLQYTFRPAAFIDHSIIFSAKSGGTSMLWRLPVSTVTWRVSGAAVPLTAGPGLHLHAGAAGTSPRRYVFSALSLRSSIVGVPATGVGSKEPAVPKRWTEGLDLNTYPSISRDGTRLAYISNRSGNPDVWLKNLRTGRDAALTETPWAESYARISPSGLQVMFIASRGGGKRNLGWIDSAGGISRTYCGNCEGTLYGAWIHERSFVYTTAKGLSVLRIPSGESSELVNGPVLEPRGSYDGRWIVFHSTPQPTIRQVFVAPVRNTVVPRGEWIPITGEDGLNRNAAWAPDGRHIYFLSDRDGFRCIWVQKLDAASKRPLGEPVPLHHAHSARFSLFNFIGQGLISLTATEDQLFFAQPEITGNIWMMETTER